MSESVLNLFEVFIIQVNGKMKRQETNKSAVNVALY